MVSGSLDMIELYFGIENRNTSELFNQCGDMHYVPEYRAVSRLIDVKSNPETIKVQGGFAKKCENGDFFNRRWPKSLFFLDIGILP